VPSPVEEERNNAQGKKDEKENFGDANGGASNPSEAKNSGYQCDDQKYECVVEHDDPLAMDRIGSHSLPT